MDGTDGTEMRRPARVRVGPRASPNYSFRAISREVGLNRATIKALFDEWDIDYGWNGQANVVTPEVYRAVRPRLVAHWRKRTAKEATLTTAR